RDCRARARILAFSVRILRNAMHSAHNCSQWRCPMLSTSKCINIMASVTSKAALIGAAVALSALSTSAQTAKDVKGATPPQNATDSCKPTHVIPLTGSEPSAKIVIDPPLAEPLASRGVAIIEYCAQNLHIAPVFGPGAVSASPRVGHIHVSLDEAPWVWADA